jgi:hypothetical protein
MVAVIALVPVDTAVTTNGAIETPPGMTSEAGTVATAGLALASVTVAPAAGAVPVSVTTPPTVVPDALVEGVSAMPDTARIVVGPVPGDEGLHRVVMSAAAPRAMSATEAVLREVVIRRVFRRHDADGHRSSHECHRR